MNSFTLITAWGATRESGTQIQLHNHDFYEVVYYLQGSGDSRVGDNYYSIRPHSFVVIPPMVEHEEHHTAKGELFCIGFQSPELLTSQHLADSSGSVCQLCKTIIHEITEQGHLYTRMINLKLQELAVEIHRKAHSETKSASKNFQYVINYLSQNYHEKICLCSMAQQLSLSYDYFQHRFKEIVGVSPQQFLIRKRLEAALTLLRTTNLNCTEIAYRCGFSNSAQFSAVFKRETGMTPREFVRHQTDQTL